MDYICRDKTTKIAFRMKKYYLFLLFAASCCLPTMATENAVEAEAPDYDIEFEAPIPEQDFDATAINDPDSELMPITINISGTQVHVANAVGKSLEIYNLAGVRVASFKIDSDDKTVSINLPKGCYILKVDKVVRKVSLK